VHQAVGQCLVATVPPETVKTMRRRRRRRRRMRSRRRRA
jgi:hypothetical protein